MAPGGYRQRANQNEKLGPLCRQPLQELAKRPLGHGGDDRPYAALDEIRAMVAGSQLFTVTTVALNRGKNLVVQG